MSLSIKSLKLKVVEKFRAPAALYTPAKNPGDGWSVVSGPKRGGHAIIQIQQSASDGATNIPVVRFLLHHGKAVLNARIMHGLPIRQVNNREIRFKCVSTTTSDYRQRTIFAILFQSANDTRDFMKLWRASNGSIKSLLKDEKESTRKILSGSKDSNTTDGTGHIKVNPSLKQTISEEEKEADIKSNTRLKRKASAAIIAASDSPPQAKKLKVLDSKDEKNQEGEGQQTVNSQSIASDKINNKNKDFGLHDSANPDGKLITTPRKKTDSNPKLCLGCKGCGEEEEEDEDDDSNSLVDEQGRSSCIALEADSDRSTQTNSECDSSDDEEDVEVDFADAPQSQNWMSAFEW